MTIFLFDKIDANDPDGNPVTISGGERQVQIEAKDFGGGTITLQTQIDSRLETWQTVPIQDGGVAEFTQNTISWLKIPTGGTNIKAIFTGSSGASEVTVVLSGDED